VRSNDREDTRHQFIHHGSSASFRLAIELQCSICMRLCASFEHEHVASMVDAPAVDMSIVGPTTYERAPIGSDAHSAVIVFKCGTYLAPLVLELWSGKRTCF
jgi:hypothetical protein